MHDFAIRSTDESPPGQIIRGAFVDHLDQRVDALFGLDKAGRDAMQSPARATRRPRHRRSRRRFAAQAE